MKWLVLAALAAGLALALNVIAGDTITNAGPQWTVPPHWREMAAGPAMVKAYSPTPDSTGAIVATVSRLPNAIHRERPPLILPRIELSSDRRDLSRSTISLPDPQDRATMLDMEGRDPDTFAPRREIVITVARSNTVTRQPEEWLYKLIGDKGAVTAQKDVFIKFVQSAHYP